MAHIVETTPDNSYRSAAKDTIRVTLEGTKVKPKAKRSPMKWHWVDFRSNSIYAFCGDRRSRVNVMEPRLVTCSKCVSQMKLHGHLPDDQK